MNSRIIRYATLLGCFALMASAGIANAEEAPKVSVAIPAIPPIFVGVQVMVAKDEGFFEKFGLDVDVRNFPNGAEASRAAASGDVDASLSPTPLIINQISNAGIAYVGIYGTEKPAYYLASLDPDATCEGMAGQAVGVDTPGGATSIALKTMLASCGLSINDVQQVPLSANVPTAMIGGQLQHGVLHLDGMIAVEDETGKNVNPVIDYLAVRQVYHNMLLVVRRDKLDENRDHYVRVVAALIAAERFMRDPANAATVAKIAAPTGRTEAQAEESLKRYIDIGFWPHDASGLTEANIEAVKAAQVKVGNIRPGKTPVAYADLVDPSIFEDAMALVDNAQ